MYMYIDHDCHSAVKSLDFAVVEHIGYTPKHRQVYGNFQEAHSVEPSLICGK
jgi:hypothetical protein